MNKKIVQIAANLFNFTVLESLFKKKSSLNLEDYILVEGKINEGDKCLFQNQILTVLEFTHDDTVCFVENPDSDLQEIPEAFFGHMQ